MTKPLLSAQFERESFTRDITIGQGALRSQVHELYWIEICNATSIEILDLASEGMMTNYGQYCPVARAAEILNERWTLLILRDLLGGARRFNDIRRGVPRMSPSLLSKRLKYLESAGLIARRRVRGSKVAEYVPTPAGREVQPIIELYGAWGQRWVRNRLGDDELDVNLLMWYLRCGIDKSHFFGERIVVRFEFTDRPRLKKDDWWVDQWWLIVSRDEIDLCVQDPGHDVDLYVVSDLRTMTRVSLGDIPVPQALRDGLIELHGSRSLAESFADWLPRSSHATVARPPQPLDFRTVVTPPNDWAG